MKGAEYLVPAGVVWVYTISAWYTEGVFYFCFDWINNDSLSLNNKVWVFKYLKFNVTISLTGNNIELSPNYIMLWMWFWFLSFCDENKQIFFAFVFSAEVVKQKKV